MGFVDTSLAGKTELRVHGVSGTTPEDMLGHPHVRRVAGDRSAGIYRRVWEHRGHAEDTEDTEDTEQRHLEGYSWGGLTSGSWKRALWLLLLPFTLVNVAFFMTPRSPLRETARWATLRRVSTGVQRALALSLTITMVLTAVTVGMDLAGWQCGRPEMSCAGRWGPGLLDQSWLDDAGKRLVASALLPAGLVALLWWLANKTWELSEATPVPPGPAQDEDNWQTPLEGRDMWNGRATVARLRALHVSAGLAVVGLFVTVPLLDSPRDGVLALFKTAQWTRDGGLLPSALMTLFLLVLLVCALAVSLGRFERERPDDEQHGSGWEPLLAYATVLLLLVAALTTWTSEGGRSQLRIPERPTILPWLTGAALTTFIVQFLLLVALTVICAVQARSARGMTQVVLAGMAWVLLGGLAAAVILRAAAAFGDPAYEASASAGDAVLLLPAHYFWAALAALCGLAAALLATALAVRTIRRASKRLFESAVADAYPARRLRDDPSPEDRARGMRIAKAWASASVSEVARSTLLLLSVVILGTLIVGIIGFSRERDWPVETAPGWLVTAGSFVMTAAVASLLYVGRQAYRNPSFRRTVGILWDLGTFWPRATHPLAPPCYAERTIPDLVRRIEGTRESGQVLLSAHSQGSVICAAVVAQLHFDDLRRVALLTYGSPLRRLYAALFPAYFGPPALTRLGELLSSPDEPRGRWPWLNLYRVSDPIGGWLFADHPAVEVEPEPDVAVYANGDVDWQLVDPRFLRRTGDGCYPETQGHSNYFADPAYGAAIELLWRRRDLTEPSPPRHTDPKR